MIDSAATEEAEIVSQLTTSVGALADLEKRFEGNDHLDRSVREIVAGHRRTLEAQALPIDELWTQLWELDPVLGNPARYNGKVVLLALVPVTYETLTERIDDLHAEFHHAGLEILQIAPFNHAYGLPSEPEQQRDMERIVARRGWPWPVLWNPAGTCRTSPGNGGTIRSQRGCSSVKTAAS